MLARLRAAATRWALHRARRADGERAERWYDRATRWTPHFSRAYRELVDRRVARRDPAAALRVARRGVDRFPASAEAWIVLGIAYEAHYRVRDALVAFEQSLVLEERPDAAMAAGRLYRQLGDPVNAGARFARAYAAGAGPDALKANAEMLYKAGDHAAAEAAERRWRAETETEG